MIYQKITLVVESLENEKKFIELKQHIQAHYEITPEIKNIFDDLTQESNRIYLLYLSDDEIKSFFVKNISTPIKIAIIPNNKCPNAMKSYGIADDIYEALDDAFDKELLSSIDLLLCNGALVFNRVYIGDMHDYSTSEQNSFFSRVQSFFKNLINIKYKSITLTTSKEQVINTAASGIMVLEHTTTHSSYINEDLSLHDGKLNAFILAPTSLLVYFYYLLVILFYKSYSSISLPKSLGLIRSSRLKIESNKPFDFTIDKVAMSAVSIELEVISDGINLHLGRKLREKVKIEQPKDEKDTVKITTLPKGEIRNLLVEGNLPLFTKAEDDDFKELFVSIRENANITSVFITLMVLSVLIATTGLFQNSAPVIIGSMTLAPLMGPIISLALGISRADKTLINSSLITLGVGIFVALLFSFVYTLFIPLDILTNEMESRVHPNTLDLMVAVFSGIAGAYANSKSEVAKSLAGVAIAVALVPPLSVTGIGIGWGDLDVIMGSFLLFMTNLVGITLAAALTFIVLGYSPVRRAKKGLISVSVLLAIISIPLFFSFQSIIVQSRDFSKIDDIKHLSINNKEIQINFMKIKPSKEYTVIELEVISSSSLTSEDFQKIKESIQKRVDKEIKLEIVTKLIY